MGKAAPLDEDLHPWRDFIDVFRRLGFGGFEEPPQFRIIGAEGNARPAMVSFRKFRHLEMRRDHSLCGGIAQSCRGLGVGCGGKHESDRGEERVFHWFGSPGVIVPASKRPICHITTSATASRRTSSHTVHFDGVARLRRQVLQRIDGSRAVDTSTNARSD